MQPRPDRGSLYDGAIVEDGLITDYEVPLSNELLDARRWLQACYVNEAIAEGKKRTAPAILKARATRRYDEARKATGRARSRVHRMEKANAPKQA